VAAACRWCCCQNPPRSESPTPHCWTPFVAGYVNYYVANGAVLIPRLSDHVTEVRLSSRLITSPACIVGDTHDFSPTLEKMYRAMGQELPQIKRILELNPTHPLVTRLHNAYGEREDRTGLSETVELLYGMALLAEGGELTDPSRFIRLLSDRLERTL